MTSTRTTPTQEHHSSYSRRHYEPAAVTQEQLDRCVRCIDGATGEVFYCVASESNPEKDYTVRALRRHGKYYTTCTCPAGQGGTSCKHVRWAKAHAKEYWKLREAATEILNRTERHGGKVEYIVRDETGYNLVRLGRTCAEDHCCCPESIPMEVPCHHLRVVRHAERQYRKERADYLRGIA